MRREARGIEIAKKRLGPPALVAGLFGNTVRSHAAANDPLEPKTYAESLRAHKLGALCA
jgi:hypothetical protein